MMWPGGMLKVCCKMNPPSAEEAVNGAEYVVLTFSEQNAKLPVRDTDSSSGKTMVSLKAGGKTQ